MEYRSGNANDRDSHRISPTSDDVFSRQKQELHSKLVAAMDLSTLGSMNEEELRREVRRVAEEMTRQSADLLGIRERERLVSEVLDETFGLGPARALDARPDDHRHPGQRAQGRLRRARGPARASRCRRSTTSGTCVQIVQRIAGRVGRRVDETDPDGRRPAGRRQPRQRDHPAAGARRHPALDPAVRRPGRC